jgi:hypothetical protein
MTKDEALAFDLALEALVYLRKPMAKGWDAETQMHKRENAITAIKKVRSAPVQEPIYIQLRCKDAGYAYGRMSEWGNPIDPKFKNDRWADGVEMRLLYTDPPAQRQWVSLTVAEMEELTLLVGRMDYTRMLQLAEAKLKEKNT